ncbi:MULTISPECIES: type II secretion system inner membrane protein GspF [unclassified Anaeromyxobacter]|uniref:type II secretion system inner membrane protein GspF n=1 Tax=unclassified Anaeromyxobacter TaxID=2620896 RepID=UPI001F577E56|nr:MULTISPECIES: type II secretion system inner membrane protein GspF [unclassified Anaeromyxobacter]
MPVFQYKALNAAGKAVQGLKEADSPKTLRANLRREGVFLTEVLGEAQAKREVNVRRWVLGRVGARDLAVATRQLAVLAHAGIPLVEALTALVDQVEHERLKRVLGDVKQRVNEGSSLADALAVHPRVFSTLYVNMIRAGESSGALEIVLVRLAEFTESQARLRSKIAGTMAYPIAMMVIGTGIMGILFTVVIPKITSIFENTSATLPWYTQVTIGISSFASRWWWAILLAGVAAVYGLARWRRTPAGRAAWDRAALRAPIFGPIIRQIAIGRFARTLSTLLKSGVPLLTAMDIVKNILGNTRLAEVIEQARDAIREGESIAAPLKRSGEFPPLVHHMVAIGERSGALEEMLANVADAYEDQVETTIAALTSLLEPVMIVAMGGVVAFIVFSVLMPILQINNLVGG